MNIFIVLNARWFDSVFHLNFHQILFVPGELAMVTKKGSGSESMYMYNKCNLFLCSIEIWILSIFFLLLVCPKSKHRKEKCRNSSSTIPNGYWRMKFEKIHQRFKTRKMNKWMNDEGNLRPKWIYWMLIKNLLATCHPYAHMKQPVGY